MIDEFINTASGAYKCTACPANCLTCVGTNLCLTCDTANNKIRAVFASGASTCVDNCKSTDANTYKSNNGTICVSSCYDSYYLILLLIINR